MDPFRPGRGADPQAGPEPVVAKVSAVRTLLAHRGGLACGALAFLLEQAPGIDLVERIDNGQDVERAIRRHLPEVSVIDLDLLGADGVPVVWSVRRRLPGTRILILAARHRWSVLSHAIGRPGQVGSLAKESPPDRLAGAIRALSRGEPVGDPGLAGDPPLAGSPLTPREQEILWVAANGAPVREIAATLRLSSGTVHNHLSRIIGKTRSRSRVEAINVARDAGWI